MTAAEGGADKEKEEEGATEGGDLVSSNKEGEAGAEENSSDKPDEGCRRSSNEPNKVEEGGVESILRSAAAF